MMKNVPIFFLLFIFTACLVSCNPDENTTGCDEEDDCFSLQVDGEDFLASSTSATTVSLLGNSTITISGRSDVSSPELLAMAVSIVNPAKGNFTINALNSSQKSIKYYDESGNPFLLNSGVMEILQYETEDVIIEGTFSGEASYNNETKSFTNGYFIVNQPE